MIGWLVAPFVIGLISGIPIAFSLALGTIVFLTVSASVPMEVLAQQMYQAAASFPLMAIPFFLLAGELMSMTGITARLIRFATLLVGRLHGGLGYVMVIAGTIFGGISGSGAADTAALGKVLTPEMEKEGYQKDFSAALAAATGVLGPIIPPSIVMIVYGSLMNVSIGALFIAGIAPGLLIAIGLMIAVRVESKRRNFPKREKAFCWSELLQGFKDASLALLMPVIILVGIRGGVFTPTEGGAIAVVYALLLGLFVYRTLTVKDIVAALLSSGVMAATIMIIVAAANPFGWLLSLNQAPQMMAQLILAITENKYFILFLINVLLLIVGMLMETNAIILLLAPILAPIAVKVGVDPLHFAIVMIVNLCIGLATPPVGLNLFISAPVAGVKLEEVTSSIWPFLAVELIILAIITYFPAVVLSVPRWLG